MNRVQGIAESVRNYFPDLDFPVPAKEEVWYGFRPCSPDGLPYIGPTNRFGNLIMATGHGMMGLSLAPATGKLVSQLVSGSGTEINISSFSPKRYL